MAHKNGIGANRDKKATTYEAVAPDGSKLKKKSFVVHSDTALMGVFKHGGKWMASGITDEEQDWGAQIFIPATRLTA